MNRGDSVKRIVLLLVVLFMIPIVVAAKPQVEYSTVFGKYYYSRTNNEEVVFSKGLTGRLSYIKFDGYHQIIVGMDKRKNVTLYNTPPSGRILYIHFSGISESEGATLDVKKGLGIEVDGVEKGREFRSIYKKASSYEPKQKAIGFSVITGKDFRVNPDSKVVFYVLKKDGSRLEVEVPKDIVKSMAEVDEVEITPELKKELRKKKEDEEKAKDDEWKKKKAEEKQKKREEKLKKNSGN